MPTPVVSTSLLDKGIALVTSTEFLVGAGAGTLATLGVIGIKKTYFPSNVPAKRKPSRKKTTAQKVATKVVRASGNVKARVKRAVRKVAFVRVEKKQ